MEEDPKPPSLAISVGKEKNGEGEKQKTLVRKNRRKRKEKRSKRTKSWAEKMQRFRALRQIEADVSRIRTCLPPPHLLYE